MRLDSAFWLAYIVIGSVAAVLLLGAGDLPVCDLPQHSAQLAIWVHYDDPAFGFAENFELHPFTPNVVAYLLARPFVGLLGVVGAMKAVLVFAALANSLSLCRLARVVGRDPWLGLIGLPLSLGFSFYFGLINFAVASSLVFLIVAEALSFVEQPTKRRALWIAALTSALFFCHGLAHAFALAIVGCVILFGRSTWRERFAGWALLLPSVLLALVWSPELGAVADLTPQPDKWDLGWFRALDLPGSWLGVGSVDVTATVAGLALLALMLASGCRPSRCAIRWVPFVMTVALYFVFPMKFRGLHLLSPRFAFFVLPFLLIALDSRAAAVRIRVVRIAVVSFSLLWFGVLAVRFAGFSEEARGFHVVAAEIPMNQRIRPLIFDVQSASVPGGAPFLHFPAYVQVESGGRFGFSFGLYPTAFARYRADTRFGTGMDFRPQNFSLVNEGDFYDYFVVRSERDRASELFGAGGDSMVEVIRSDAWRLYARRTTVER